MSFISFSLAVIFITRLFSTSAFRVSNACISHIPQNTNYNLVRGQCFSKRFEGPFWSLNPRNNNKPKKPPETGRRKQIQKCSKQKTAVGLKNRQGRGFPLENVEPIELHHADAEHKILFTGGFA